MSDISRRRILLVLALLFLMGAAVRLIDFQRPVGTIRYLSWREGDLGSIARTFYREDMNIFYPRVDWRGDGPGYAEMEFPLYSWLLACMYRAFGYHEILGRVLSYVLALATMLVFFSFMRRMLRPREALVACAFYVLSPLSIRISATLQAEGLMFFFYLVAAYAFIEWLEGGSRWAYWISVSSTAVAILGKAPAAHIGLFFAFLILREKGFRETLRMPATWLFSVGALLPGVLWYAHAHRLYLQFGNSLGASNMHHWVDLDVFLKPQTFLAGILQNEIEYVWTPAAILVCALGAWFGRGRKTASTAAGWLGAVMVYYVVTARTNGQDWAAYYHIVSLPAVALLFAMGTMAVARLVPPSRFLRIAAGCAVVAAGVVALMGRASVLGEASHRLYYLAGLLLLYAAGLTVIAWLPREAVTGSDGTTTPRPWLFLAAVLCLTATPLFQAQEIYWDIVRTGHKEYECVKDFGRLIPEGSLIVASGFHERDPYNPAYGSPYNISRYFFWLDRKGFNIPAERQNLETLEGYVKRGARYYVAEKSVLREAPGFEEQLVATYPILAECGTAYLLEIDRHKP